MKILEVQRFVADVQRNTREIPFRRPQYIIHRMVDEEYSVIQMA